MQDWWTNSRSDSPQVCWLHSVDYCSSSAHSHGQWPYSYHGCWVCCGELVVSMHVYELSVRGLGILPVTAMYRCNAHVACCLTGFELYLLGVEWCEVFQFLASNAKNKSVWLLSPCSLYELMELRSAQESSLYIMLQIAIYTYCIHVQGVSNLLCVTYFCTHF